MKREKIRTEYYDLVVVGGGMAGLCAAVAAARHGVKTALVHARPVLGGNASGEVRMHICGAGDNGRKPALEEGGLLHEILLRNKACNDHFNYSVWDSVLWQTAKEEKNLTLYLNTALYDCEMEGDTIRAVACFQSTTEYRIRLEAPLFVDSTGNGTLGYFAGAEYREGSESRGEFGEPHAPEQSNRDRMGNTILFKAVRREQPVPFTPPPFAKKLTEHQLRYRMHSQFHTVDTSSALDPAAFVRSTTGSTTAVDYGYWWIELMGQGEDFVGQYEDIRDDLLGYVYGVWDHIKNGGEHGAGCYDLEWVGALPGMRESRRLVGDYLLNENDILENRRFSDAVAYGGWPMDIHCPNGLLDFDRLPSEIIPFEGTYTIPWRCYYSRNISNLMMAGRDISTTRMALGSTRIMGTCAIGGQAVGTAAALCKQHGCLPGQLSPHIPVLQQMLLRDDAYIPGVVNADPADLARTAAVTASSHKSDCQPADVISGVSRPENGRPNRWCSDGISLEGEWLRLTLPKKAKISTVQITFDSGFAYPIRITLSDNRRRQQRPGVPPELVRDYTVELLADGQPVAARGITDNIQRLNRIAFAGEEADEVRIHLHNTHGCEDIHVFEVRIYE